MKPIQIRIFAQQQPDSNWFETLLGRIVKPMIETYDENIKWFWFSHYVQMYNNGNWGDIGDCDFENIPDKFLLPVRGQDPKMHRSMRWRIFIEDLAISNFEKDLMDLINKYDYWSSGLMFYDYLNDLGSDRFLGIEYRNDFTRRAARADIIVNYLHALAKFRLDAIILLGNDEFERETNTDHGNHDHPFEGIRHMCENIVMERT